MAKKEELRLQTRVARMYYDSGVSQSKIAKELKLAQPQVSRLLKRAQDNGIVRISVGIPAGVHSDLEDAIRERYGLAEAIVADCPVDSEAETQRAVGAAAAYYLETTLCNGEVVGISSWSATLLAMLNALHPVRNIRDVRVVQILGGLGSPVAEVHAFHLIKRLSELVLGRAVMLPAPGVAPTPSARKAFESDMFVQEAQAAFEDITLALVGIGAADPSDLLSRSGNTFSADELNSLKTKGVVGDICLRFFDNKGTPVSSPLDKRVIAMSLEQLERVNRVVGVAGGARKTDAIRGALMGKLVNVLITDRFTAHRLVCTGGT